MSNLYENHTIRDIQNIKERYKGKKIGFTCGCFDLLHTGYLIMLKEAKDQCEVLVVGLQSDPTINRPYKNKPILNLFERKTMLTSLKYIDEIIDYNTESDLYNILLELKPNVRIIGDDWKRKEYTGYDIKDIPIYWHTIKHNYSVKSLCRKIYNIEKYKQNIIGSTYHLH
jgi:glycerol-3-phosphate cytidylyltransferase